MKKTIIIACLCMLANVANAQFWVGGQFHSSKGKSEYLDGNKVKTRTFKLLPEVGYSLNDDWDIAVRIGIDYSKAKFSSDPKKAASAIVFEPYARYKLCEISNFDLFIDGGVGIENGDFFYNGQYYKSETLFGIGIRPGLRYKATDKLTLTATFGGLGYRHINKNDDFGFNFNGNSLTIGCYYNL